MTSVNFFGGANDKSIQDPIRLMRKDYDVPFRESGRDTNECATRTSGFVGRMPHHLESELDGLSASEVAEAERHSAGVVSHNLALARLRIESPRKQFSRSEVHPPPRGSARLSGCKAVTPARAHTSFGAGRLSQNQRTYS
jgi:hypothetical protein